MKFKAEGLIIASVFFIRELSYSISCHWVVLHQKRSGKELVNYANNKRVEECCKAVGSGANCAPVTGLQYEVIRQQEGTPFWLQIMWHTHRKLLFSGRNTGICSGLSKILLVSEARPSWATQEARGDPAAHIRDAQLTAGRQTPRK